MTATIFALTLFIAVANAGFIGAPAVVTPAFARIAAPTYYAYHTPFAYHAPITVTAPPAAKAEAPTAPKEPAVAPAPPASTPAPAAKPAAPAKDSAPEEDADYNPNPSYSFSYDVKDDETGDTKTQSESLENGVVKGSYTVVDPDGVKRTVEYTADAVNGFNAVVNMEPSDVVIKSSSSKMPPSPAAQAATAASSPTSTSVPAKASAALLAAAPAAFYHAYTAPLAYHAAVAKVVPAQVAKLVSPPLSYTSSHIYHPSTVTYAAAPLHHKVIYA